MFPGERSIKAASDTVAFDKLNENDVALAYLPLAWSAIIYLKYAQGLVAGFCMACPESADTAMSDLREIGPSFYFAPPRTLEVLLTQRDDPHGGAGALKRSCSTISSAWRAATANASSTAAGAAAGRLLYAIGNALVYGPLKNVLGFRACACLYRGRGDRAGLFAFYRSLGLNLKQLYGQTEAFLYVTAQPDGEIYSDTVGAGAIQTSISARRQWRGAVQVARHVLRLFQGRCQDHRGDRRRTAT